MRVRIRDHFNDAESFEIKRPFRGTEPRVPHTFALFANEWASLYWQSLPMMLGWVLQLRAMERTAAMPTRNVNLTSELDRFVTRKVKSGRYENASEVVRAGLRTLEREEQQYAAKLAALRAAIDEGDASGIAGGDVFGRVRKAIKDRVSR